LYLGLIWQLREWNVRTLAAAQLGYEICEVVGGLGVFDWGSLVGRRLV
jgi:hypothetical protein